jgi:cyclin L
MACASTLLSSQPSMRPQLELPTPCTLGSTSVSREDGIDGSVEEGQLLFGAELIADSGLLLRLPQVAIVSAHILFHRFFLVVSLKAHSHVWVAASALLVASKAEEQPRKIRDIANVVYHCFCIQQGIGQRDVVTGELLPLDYYGRPGYEWKLAVTTTESHLLRELGFRVLVEHPHKFVLVFVNTLRDKAGCGDWNDKSAAFWCRIMQLSWNYANDAHRMQLAVLERPEVIACACINLAAADAMLNLPDGWLDVFGADASDCKRFSGAITRLYSLPQTAGRFEDLAMSNIVSILSLK